MTTTQKRCDILSLKDKVNFEPEPLSLFVQDSLLNHSLLCNGQEIHGLEKLLLYNKTVLSVIYKYGVNTCKSQQVLQKYLFHRENLSIRLWSPPWYRLPTADNHCQLSSVYNLHFIILKANIVQPVKQIRAASVTLTI